MGMNLVAVLAVLALAVPPGDEDTVPDGPPPETPPPVLTAVPTSTPVPPAPTPVAPTPEPSQTPEPVPTPEPTPEAIPTVVLEPISTATVVAVEPAGTPAPIPTATPEVIVAEPLRTPPRGNRHPPTGVRRDPASRSGYDKRGAQDRARRTRTVTPRSWHRDTPADPPTTQRDISTGLGANRRPGAPTSRYVIRPGDTLWGIAGRDWPRVARLNHLKNPDLIYPGQTILL